MKITEKVLEIYKEYSICPYCLGRMFSLLATDTTNLERGQSILLTITMQLHQEYLSSKTANSNLIISKLKLLAEEAKFPPARKVLDKEGMRYSTLSDNEKCYLCQDIFFNLENYANFVTKKLEKYEYENILVGTKLNPKIVNREDQFKVKFEILGSESFKSHFNRELGKILNEKLKKDTEFHQPEMTIICLLSYDSFSVNLVIRSLFIYGRYNKFLRGIPQTHWDCRKCHGKGCESCNFSGKQYPTSVEELINPEFKIAANSEESSFHGAGREDIDVKMLGEGRPFILELKSPVNRSLNLEKLQKQVNKQNRKKIKINNLRFTTKEEVKKIKNESEKTVKIYKALVKSPEMSFSKKEFKKLLNILNETLKGKNIKQRTPFRVSHRRSDKIRTKKIYDVKGTYKKSRLFEFIIETQGGTYIKELINGDEGRTNPSLAEIFGTPLTCKELDVIHIGT